MKRLFFAAAAALTLSPGTGVAQEPPVRWQRREAPTVPPVSVFHATQSANLATAETLRRGEWLFEISHRFLPPVSGGAEALWGLDGPVVNRLGLSYAVSDRAMVGLVRSNLADNVELGSKLKLAEGGRNAIPFQVALNAAVAWKGQLPNEGGLEDGESQAYVQILLNALFGGRLAAGAAPTVLRNPRVEDATAATTFALGLHAQLYVSEQVSLLGEWVATERRPGLEHDAGSFGIELETGGHFFRLLLSNSARMNPSQFLGGTPYAFEPDQWRLGFNVTRVLVF